MITVDHRDIVRSCEGDFERFGDSFLGAGWTKTEEAADRRYQVMLDFVTAGNEFTLLDFGCGTARLLDYATRTNVDGMTYGGLDLSSKVIDVCRRKYPDRRFYVEDVLGDGVTLPIFDFVVMNGIFHYKGEMSHAEMYAYFCRLLGVMANHARKGIAFNVMSKYVEWERDDLFHLPVRDATDFIASVISRSFTIRHDYGLYEYTVYVHV